MQTTIELPPPVEMTMPFSQVLGRRRSRREFSDQSLDLPLLSTLLWACAGQNGADGRRTAPSALDSREVECFVFDQKGVWSYCAETNALKLLAEGDHRSATTAGQDFVHSAPVTLIFAVNQAKTERISGGRQAPSVSRSMLASWFKMRFWRVRPWALPPYRAPGLSRRPYFKPWDSPPTILKWPSLSAFRNKEQG